MSAAALGCRVQVDEWHGRTANTEHQDPKQGDFDPDLDASGRRSNGKQGDHECHGDRITNHFDGEGLGRRPGDSEIGDDYVRQAWNPGDIHLECSCGKSPCAVCSLARCVTKSVKGQVTSYATQIVECSLQGQWGGEQPSQYEYKPAADADTGQDDQDHDGCAGLSKSLGIGWGRESRFIIPKPTAKSPAITTRTIWPAGVEDGVN